MPPAAWLRGWRYARQKFSSSKLGARSCQSLYCWRMNASTVQNGVHSAVLHSGTPAGGAGGVVTWMVVGAETVAPSSDTTETL